MTTWEPTPWSKKSPDGMDAMVHGIWELLNLAATTVDHRAGFKGLEQIAEELANLTKPNPSKISVSLAHLMKGRGDGGKI